MDDSSIRSHYACCRAFVFCGEEDFGITLLEAQSMGRPVIAFGRGGALETVIPDRQTWRPETGIVEDKTSDPTGVFFYEQTSDDLIKAIKHFELLESQFDQKRYKCTQQALMLVYTKTESKNLLKKDLKIIDAEETWPIISYHCNYF